MIKIVKYNDGFEAEWNTFIDNSLNGTFLFKRNYMNYHKNKFIDNSYVFINKNDEIFALFCAAYSESDKHILIAHPGLTYGGLIQKRVMKYTELEEIYDMLITQAKIEGFLELKIKPVPYTFSQEFSFGENFVFFKKKFKILNQEISSFIDLKQPIRISKGRKDNIRKAKKANIIVKYSEDYESFWEILENNLIKAHNVKPTHSINEIIQLAQSNKNNIKLIIAVQEDETIGGIVLYLDTSKKFVHTQYISANDVGKKCGAVDFLISFIIDEFIDKVDRLSFGTSSVKGEINYNLLFQKEGFGTVTDVFTTYSLELDAI